MSHCVHRGLGAALLALAASGFASASPGAMKILYHEVVNLIPQQERVSQPAGTSAERISFEAYGRRFDLLLEPNERLRLALPTRRGTPRPLRGMVEGSSKSWVRLTRDEDGSWRGVIAVEGEIYAIEPAADIAEAAVQPLAEPGTRPVMFRLSDTLLSLGPGFCGTTATDEPPTALAAYESLTQELQSQTAQATLTKQLDIGIVADYQFSQHFQTRMMDPQQAIIARMNIVEGIYSSQLGLKIEMAPPTLLGVTDTSFTKTDASGLLDELRRYRSRTPQQASLGITHLMTGRNLDGETVGIAYMGSVCSHEYGASLSEGIRSTTTAALIAAHEIGHNFDAPHDGEGACETMPSTFLVAPQLNGNDQFSACSLERIRALMANPNRASCLSDIEPADAAVSVPTGSVSATIGAAFTLLFSVQAVGGQDSTSVTASATLPASFTVNSSSVAEGSCTNGAGTVSCFIGTLSAGQSRQISLNLTGQSAGTFPVTLAVTSANDAAAGNDSGQVSVTVSQSAPPVSNPAQNSSGGGGGGFVDATLLLWLASLLSVHGLRRAAPRAHS